MQPNAETIAELVEQSRLAATPLVTPLGKARGLLLRCLGVGFVLGWKLKPW